MIQDMLISTPVQAVARPEEGAATAARDSGFSEILSLVTGQSAPDLTAGAPAASLPIETLPSADCAPVPEPIVAPAENKVAGNKVVGNKASAISLQQVAVSPVQMAPVQTVPAEVHSARQAAETANPARAPAEPAAHQEQAATVQATDMAAPDPGGDPATEQPAIAAAVAPAVQPRTKSAAPSSDEERAEPAEPSQPKVSDASAPLQGPAVEPRVPLAVASVPLSLGVPQAQAAETAPVEGQEAAVSSLAPSAAKVPSATTSAPAPTFATAAGEPVAPPMAEAAASAQDVSPEPGSASDGPTGTSHFADVSDGAGTPLPIKTALEPKAQQTFGAGLPQPWMEPLAQAGFGQGSFGKIYPAQATGPIIDGRSGVVGRGIGLEIARSVTQGRDEMILRLSPESLGRVEVRIAFDHDGGLRAVLSADQPATTALLQREVPNLVRALADAGIRSDDSSVQFQSPSNTGQSDSGQSGAGSGDRNRGSRQDQRQQGQQSAVEDLPLRSFRAIRAGSRVDLVA